MLVPLPKGSCDLVWTRRACIAMDQQHRPVRTANDSIDESAQQFAPDQSMAGMAS